LLLSAGSYGVRIIYYVCNIAIEEGDGMNWNRCFIGINHKTIGMFIGIGDLKNDGTIKYVNKSDDRTTEIINAVARFMSIKLNKSKEKKHYFGYEVPKCGKLVLIKPGYDFYVIRNSDITQPLANF